jgi:hypothetical protein
MAQLDDRDQLARRVADLQKQEEKLVLRSGQRVQQAPGGGGEWRGGLCWPGCREGEACSLMMGGVEA